MVVLVEDGEMVVAGVESKMLPHVWATVDSDMETSEREVVVEEQGCA